MRINHSGKITVMSTIAGTGDANGIRDETASLVTVKSIYEFISEFL
jgi:hypothetical protein